MVPLFLGLTAVNLLLLTTAAALGYVTAGARQLGHWHILAGAMATITCVGVHCVVFTYFIATAKWVQHAVTVKRLDPALAGPTRSFKALAFPAALGAMAVVFVTAVLGAVVDNYRVDPIWHHLLAMTAVAGNVAAAAAEYRAIRKNGALIDDVLEKINGVRPA